MSISKFVLISIAVFGLCGNVQISYADSSGPNSPDSVVDLAGKGTLAWTHPEYAKASEVPTPLYATVYDAIEQSWHDEVVSIVRGGVIGSENKKKIGDWSTSESYISYGGADDIWSVTWTAEDINDSDFGVVLVVMDMITQESHYLKATDFGFQIPEGAQIDGILVEIERKMVYDAGYGSYASVNHIQITITYTPAVTIQQSHYRFRDDTVVLNTNGGWLAAEDTAISNVPTEVAQRLRVAVYNENAVDQAFKLQWRISGGSWADLSSTGAIKLASSGQYSNEDAITTALLTEQSSSTWVNGTGQSDSTSTGTSSFTSGKHHTEFEWAWQFDSTASVEATYKFRVVKSDGSVLDTYYFTPQATVGSGQAEADWYDSNWGYRRAITIDPVTPEADYQVLVILTSGLGTPSYNNIEIDGSDIFFTAADGITEQKFWIEEWNDGGTSKIWVKVTNAEASTIYMYYGNPSAESASDIENTFLFGDDFSSYYPQEATLGYGKDIVQMPNGDLLLVYVNSSDIVSRISDDGGLTWGSENTIKVAGGVNYNCIHLEVFSDTIYLVYAAFLSPTAIKFKKSTDNAVSWSSEVTAINSGSHDSNIVAVASDNLLMADITGDYYGINIYKSVDGGDSWSLLSSPMSGYLNRLEDVNMKQLTNGDLLMIWEEEFVELGESRLHYSISIDNGINWSSPKTLWNEAGDDYDYEEGGIVYDSSGNLLSIAYTEANGALPTNCNYENYILKYRSSSDNGASWGPVTTLIPDTYGLGPVGSAINTSDGKILLASVTHWRGSASSIIVTRIEGDLSYPEVMMAGSKWTTGDGKVYIENDNGNYLARVEGYITGDTPKRAFIYSDYSGSDYAVRVRTKGTGADIRFSGRYVDIDNHYLFNAFTDHSIFKRVGGTYTPLVATGDAIQNGTWYVEEARLLGSSLSFYKNDVLQSSVTDSQFASGKIALGASSSTSYNPVWYDWVVVRKTTANEPDALIGGEETGVTISGKVTLSGGESDATNVLLTLSGDTNDTTYPDAGGNYILAGLQNGNYIVTPSLAGYYFLPASYSYASLDSDKTNQGFIGALLTVDSPLADPSSEDSDGSSIDCFIATAAFGTPLAEEVGALRQFRDRYLLTHKIGRQFCSFYYRHSPPLANYIAKSKTARAMVRITLKPLLWFCQAALSNAGI